MPLGTQAAWLFLLAIPVACIAWTVTHEEVFREPRTYCERQARRGSLVRRKFFYLFTCEYCFSHYVAIAVVWMADFQLVLTGWRGYLIAWFALVWIANLYMGIHAHAKLSIQGERVDIELKEEELEENER
ncbi:MAG: hypothetical protein H0W15_11770 [Gemmatimonadales bacterium]|nr:hypothetical protein [Gemmatimonadales bacterium]